MSAFENDVIEPRSPTLQVDSLPTELSGKPDGLLLFVLKVQGQFIICPLEPIYSLLPNCISDITTPSCPSASPSPSVIPVGSLSSLSTAVHDFHHHLVPVLLGPVQCFLTCFLLHYCLLQFIPHIRSQQTFL